MLPCFLQEGDLYIPTEASRGFWAPGTLNGPFIVGLLGFEIERLYGEPGWQPARLTVDLHRLPGLDPIKVTTRVVRAGGRLRLIEADFLSAGVPMARASCQFLRCTQPPPGTQWQTPGWDVPAPEQLPRLEHPRLEWDMRSITGGIGSPWPRRMWVRQISELVAGFPLTPFAQAAVVADYASALANSGDRTVGYINSDVTMYLHRQPMGDWIGLEAAYHQAAEGVANGSCQLYDTQGPIGSSSVAAIAQSRR